MEKPGDILSLRWLEAVAQELKLLAADIAGLGEQLSGDMLAGKGAGAAGLQHFDLLAQRAGAQADLLLALGARPASPAALIAHVPFHDARQRMMIAVTGAVPMVVPPGPGAAIEMELF